MRRSLLAMLAILLVATGCGKGAEQRDEPAPSESTLAGLGGSRDPSAVPTGASVIPATAMLQPEDLKGAKPAPVGPDVAPALRPPRPCGATGGSDRMRRSAAAVSVVFTVGDGSTLPTVILELVMLFDQDGAVRYLAELGSELGRCPGPDKNGRRWKATTVGPDEVVLTVTEPIEMPDGDKGSRDLPVTVTRVGNVVVVLADIGWEFGGGHPEIIRTLTPKATARADAAM